GTANYAQKFQG
nr:immunoglobulin heavy chain junction region [Homo sapiens]